MMSPVQMFDVNAINAGRQAGMQRGAVNSPFTPLGQALDGVLKRYDAHLSAQQTQNNALELQRLKNQGDIDTAKVSSGAATVEQPDWVKNFDPTKPPTMIVGGQKVIVSPDVQGKTWVPKYTPLSPLPLTGTNPPTDFGYDTVGQYAGEAGKPTEAPNPIQQGAGIKVSAPVGKVNGGEVNVKQVGNVKYVRKADGKWYPSK